MERNEDTEALQKMSSVVFEEGENASFVELFHGWSRWCVKLTTVMGGESFPICLC